MVYSLVNVHVLYYVSYIGMYYVNIIGFGIFISFFIQFFSGILLCMYYNSCFIISFDSILYLMIEVLFGYLIRSFHCVFAVFFMFMVYIHLFRGVWLRLLALEYLYLVWLSGILLLLLCIIEGFIGYILNYGQMSYWGYMVLCGLCSILGYYIYGYVLEVVWCSGYVVVYRIFLIHFMIGWIIGVIIWIHIIMLHMIGSNNPMVMSISTYSMSFKLIGLKDIMIVVLVVSIFIEWMGYIDDIFGNEDNMEVANPLSTPEHIVPEIYFDYLFYLLRSISIKYVGVYGVMMWLCVILL